MKKVLIITHLQQASPRIPAISKYLPEFGWEPIILTVPVPAFEKEKLQCRVIEAPYVDTVILLKKFFGFKLDKDMKRQLKEVLGIRSKRSFLDFLLRKCGEIVLYPDSTKGWERPALKAAERLLGKGNIDALISSSSPVTSHIIARRLKGKYKIPWIADLRDLWTQNHNYSYGRLRRLVEKRLELKTLATADTLVTVSLPWAEKLGKLHQKPGFSCSITNGFDPVEVNSSGSSLTSKFTITYTGTIYLGKQDAEQFFIALRELISDGTIDSNVVEVRFYGYREEWLAEEIRKDGLSHIVTQHGVISHELALEKQKESQVLLLLDWNDNREKGCYPLKIFEYLSARRPIVSVGVSGDTVVRKLIEETKSGFYAKTIGEIKKVITQLYSEYKLKGEVGYAGDIEKIGKYSYREKAQGFAGILDNLVR